MVEILSLSKKYGKNKANDNVSFTVKEENVTVLLGPNGAGKSTAIKAIVGLLKYEGLITINGLENKSLKAKRITGYVPEVPALYQNLTVMEHLEFIARAYKLKNYKETARKLLERFELWDNKNKFGDELSKGMQQKLSICCSLLTNPKFIIFDEPMVGLDPHAIKELKQIFLELKQSGCSLLISTHMIDSIENIWDKTVIMQNGRVLADVEKSKLEQEGKKLEDVFFSLTEPKNNGESE